MTPERGPKRFGTFEKRALGYQTKYCFYLTALQIIKSLKSSSEGPVDNKV